MLRPIKISAVLNGFVVEAGCQKLVYNDVDVLTKELNRYLKNPNAVEKEYVSTSINAEHTSPQVVTELRAEPPACESEGRPVGYSDERPQAAIPRGNSGGDCAAEAPARRR